MKVLITGFDPFEKQKINPAFEAIKLLEDSVDDAKILKYELPTVFVKSAEKLISIINKEKPDIVICVGQAKGRSQITPEIVAINKDYARVPDNSGNKPCDKIIKQDGDVAYFTNLPYNEIIKNLHEHNIPAQLSFSAGAYVCNHVFYTLMYEIHKNHPNMIGGFIHVPFSEEQAVTSENVPFMTLEMIANSLKIIISTCVNHKLGL